MELADKPARLTVMAPTRSMALGCMLFVLVSGCAVAVPSQSATSPGAGGRVVVTNDVKPGPGGVYYIEGAIADIKLIDSNGDEIEADRETRQKTVYEGLAADDYTLEPALRPCDANCDNLDARTDVCQATLAVGHTTVHVHVRFTVGSACHLRISS